MFEQEEWNLGTARAEVTRCSLATLVDVSGLVTAPAFERLHMLMSREVDAPSICLILGTAAVLVLTNISAADAAVRGTREDMESRAITLWVPSYRAPWAALHCRLTASRGLSRSAERLQAVARPLAPERSSCTADLRS